MSNNTLSNSEIDLLIVVALHEAGFSDKEVAAVTHESGPYSVTRPNDALVRFANIILNMNNSGKSVVPALVELFPFEYQGGGYFRRRGIPKGVSAETIHGDQAIHYLYDSICKRLVHKDE